MELRVDRARCLGAGMCVLAAPEVFDQDDEGTVMLLDTAPPQQAAAEAVRQAAHLCPSGAIVVADGEPQ
jgi:ferredoxin